jgi:hypothetical protein
VVSLWLECACKLRFWALRLPDCLRYKGNFPQPKQSGGCASTTTHIQDLENICQIYDYATGQLTRARKV